MLERAFDQAKEPFEPIERLLAEAIANGTAPGFVSALADRSELLHECACGRLAIDGLEAMTNDTIVWLASMTKLVTTIAVMQLVEDDRLDLDAPVVPLLPELADPVVLDGFVADGSPALRPASAPITLRQLLCHTSGSGYEFMNADLLRARGPVGPPPATSLASLHGPLACDPGRRWHYGFGIDWAGIAVERVTGQPLDQVFAEQIFDPLGMSDTGFEIAENARDRVASIHLRGADGALAIIPSPAGSPDEQEFRPGGAGLYGTASDYLRLLRMILCDGELDGVRILRSDTVDKMWTNQIGELCAGRVDSACPALALPYDPLPGQHGQWCLLGSLNPHAVAGGRSAGSAGWVGLAGTTFWIDREAGLCAVLLAQLLPFADPGVVTLQRDFERSVYGATIFA